MPSDTYLEKLFNSQAGQSETYNSEFSDPAVITGYGSSHIRKSIQIGTNKRAFNKAVSALSSWDVHRGCGMKILSDNPVVSINSNVLIVAPIFLGHITALCRVTGLTKNDRHWGFKYCTLPHHVETGEEEFLLEMRNDETVWFTIEAHSKPSNTLVALLYPIPNLLQQRATNDYLKSMQRILSRQEVP
ncbi:MAG: DUF1990 domain-containing protein [Acidimicrobiales bacterium]|nr:DUF1990 domain-containing protein [Acidimicrobiales bacterium]